MRPLMSESLRLFAKTTNTYPGLESGFSFLDFSACSLIALVELWLS